MDALITKIAVNDENERLRDHHSRAASADKSGPRRSFLPRRRRTRPRARSVLSCLYVKDIVREATLRRECLARSLRARLRLDSFSPHRFRSGHVRSIWRSSLSNIASVPLCAQEMTRRCKENCQICQALQTNIIKKQSTDEPHGLSPDVGGNLRGRDDRNDDP